MSERPSRAELGCAGLLAAAVTVLAGGGALTRGRIGDLGMVRYAWAWIGLCSAGGLGPAVALVTVAKRSRPAVIAATLWMLVVLLACAGLAIASGGGA